MAIEHRIKVTVGTENLEVDIFEQYDVVLDLWKPGAAFTFSVPRSKEAGSVWRRVKDVLKFGGPVKFSIDDSVQFTGKIEDIATAHERGKGSVLAFAGRDLAGAAIDWDASPMVRLRGLSLGDALSALFAPLGMTVRIGASVDQTRQVQVGTARNARAITHTARRQTVDRGHPRAGERIWQVAERICARFGYMIWLAPDPDGAMSVIVDVPSYTSGTLFSLKLAYGPDGRTATSDSNILSAQQHVSTRDVPTEVNVYTSGAQGDVAGARAAARLNNLWIFNPEVMGGFATEQSLNQPRHIRAHEARTQAAAMREAQRCASMANAKSRRYMPFVQGHGERFGPGVLHYCLNAMAHVEDQEEGIDEDMLIERVHFTGGRTLGVKTQLTLHSRGAIVVERDLTGA